MDEQWWSLKNRLKPLYDPTAWSLIIVCAGGVWLYDPVMAKTVLEWILIFGVFAGASVILSRHLLPQVTLSAHVQKALEGSTGAGLVVAGICLLLSFLILAITIWGKA